MKKTRNSKTINKQKQALKEIYNLVKTEGSNDVFAHVTHVSKSGRLRIIHFETRNRSPLGRAIEQVLGFTYIGRFYGNRVQGFGMDMIFATVLKINLTYQKHFPTDPQPLLNERYFDMM